MTSDASTDTSTRAARVWRIGSTIVVILTVETIVCAIAALPMTAILAAVVALTAQHPWLRLLFLSLGAIPAYVGFALLLMLMSALAGRVTGARSPSHAEMSIAGVGWPLMRWIRVMVSIHIVRIFAGHLFRGTPIWTAYLRLCGARMGRRVYVNSLAVSDYNLLVFEDDVVVGADVHLSGHTVEGGIVKTGGVTLRRGVTIGVGSVVEIDVEIGERSQVGALSFVPKHARLEPGTVYAGIPAKRLHVA